jgi:hypothetical protein
VCARDDASVAGKEGAEALLAVSPSPHAADRQTSPETFGRELTAAARQLAGDGDTLPR